MKVYFGTANVNPFGNRGYCCPPSYGSHATQAAVSSRCGGYDHIAIGCKNADAGGYLTGQGMSTCGEDGHLKADCQPRPDEAPSARKTSTIAAPAETLNPVFTSPQRVGPTATTSRVEVTFDINSGGGPTVTGGSA
jgi:hypothetical protein